MNSPQEMVENNPRQYIIEECIPACEELWEKNIYTFMVSDHLNEGTCWIEVVFDSLSDENKDIYLNMNPEKAVKFSYHPGTVNFGVGCVGEEAKQKLFNLASEFKMQDVPQDQAYITPEDFLMNKCGCYEEYPNPNYVPMKAPWDMGLDISELSDYMNKYDKWEESDASLETLRKYAPQKATKSISEYATSQGLIYEDGRVYLNPFHYQKHQNYVEYEKSMEENNIGRRVH